MDSLAPGPRSTIDVILTATQVVLIVLTAATLALPVFTCFATALYSVNVPLAFICAIQCVFVGFYFGLTKDRRFLRMGYAQATVVIAGIRARGKTLDVALLAVVALAATGIIIAVVLGLFQNQPIHLGYHYFIRNPATEALRPTNQATYFALGYAQNAMFPALISAVGTCACLLQIRYFRYRPSGAKAQNSKET